MECSEKRYELLQNYSFSEPTTSRERYEIIRQPCPTATIRTVSLSSSSAAAGNCSDEIADPSNLSSSSYQEVPTANDGVKVRKNLGYSVYAENFNRLLQRGLCSNRRKSSMQTDGEEEEVLYYGTEAGGENGIEVEQGNVTSCEADDKQFQADAAPVQASPAKSTSSVSRNVELNSSVAHASQSDGLSKSSDAFADPDRFKTKPAISYATLVALALKNSKNGCLTVQEVYDFVDSNFPFFRTANSGWKNSVRHNLSFSKYFMKIETRRGEGDSRRSYIWTVNPARSHELEQSLAKLMERDKENTLKCLANPEDFDAIRTGTLNFKFKRPVRRKPMVQISRGEAGISRSSSLNHHEQRPAFSSNSQFKYSNTTQKIHSIRGPRRVLSFGSAVKSEAPDSSGNFGISCSADNERYESPPLPELTRLLNADGDEMFHQPAQAPSSLLAGTRYQSSLEHQSDFEGSMSELFNPPLKCDIDTCSDFQAVDLLENDDQLNTQNNCHDVSQAGSEFEFPELLIEEPVQLTPPRKWYSDCSDDLSNIVSPGNDVMLSDAIINRSPDQELKLSSFDQWQFEPVTPSRWTDFGVSCRTPQYKLARSHLL